ncbi:MAG: hypothetical protein AAFY52_12670 [Pseudomonadota bacterium]
MERNRVHQTLVTNEADALSFEGQAIGASDRSQEVTAEAKGEAGAAVLSCYPSSCQRPR